MFIRFHTIVISSQTNTSFCNLSWATRKYFYPTNTFLLLANIFITSPTKYLPKRRRIVGSYEIVLELWRALWACGCLRYIPKSYMLDQARYLALFTKHTALRMSTYTTHVLNVSALMCLRLGNMLPGIFTQSRNTKWTY